jgi:hypothetical protein
LPATAGPLSDLLPRQIPGPRLWIVVRVHHLVGEKVSLFTQNTGGKNSREFELSNIGCAVKVRENRAATRQRKLPKPDRVGTV